MEGCKIRNSIWKTIKKSAIYFCVIFAITTLVSSILQLCMGQLTDTNSHIIDRAVVVLIAVTTITLFDKLKFKNKNLSFIIPYSISMGTVFVYVWISGFWQELHPNAYRDIFLNFTAVAIVVAIAVTAKDYIKTKKQCNEK
ncbi:DUF6608 family protein [Clostridium botulinum]|uniref:DUF6608 family protein n=1 Tax=Clostridium botulinum TaxID=1491 RepID=UPI000957B484|nr:DUF6608 family protein [Clostridium botulinum]APU59718.1 putative membrane protein [Clostridium botulinum]